MKHFIFHLIPYKKLRKICCYGFTAVSLLLSIIFILRITRDGHRNRTDFYPSDSIYQLHVKSESQMVESLETPTHHLKRKRAGITIIKYNHSHHDDGANSIVRKPTTREKSLSLLSAFNSKPFKYFVYDLPSKFNIDLIKCIAHTRYYKNCFDFSNNGMGKVLSTANGFSIMNSNQFSLEVIIHQKLLHHPCRTMNISEADMFYVPAYMGLSCFCFNTADEIKDLIGELYDYLNKQKPFQKLKPHFSTLGKIEREQALNSCPLLKNQNSRKLTFIGIERETNAQSRFILGIKTQRTIVVPYPSYVHYNHSHVKTPDIAQRNVFVLLAASTRRSNHFRAMLIDQFESQTQDSYQQFFKLSKNKDVCQVMLVTSECLGNHEYTTIPWMMHSVFCLQPPGDSPTRKSIYDCILSGCIPVLFHYPSGNSVRYPYDWHFNYTDFTVILPAYDGIATYPNIYETLSKIPSAEITRLHSNVDKVAQYFQYSIISTESHALMDDAMLFLLEELRQMYNI